MSYFWTGFEKQAEEEKKWYQDHPSVAAGLGAAAGAAAATAAMRWPLPMAAAAAVGGTAGGVLGLRASRARKKQN